MERQLDVRSIILRKPFYPEMPRYTLVGNKQKSGAFPLGNRKPAVIQWEVWGHYNTLEIQKIDVQGDIFGLQNIWEHANKLSASLVGGEKMHAQFALTYDSPQAIEAFWQCETAYPLITVSVIHLKHSEDKRIMQTQGKDVINEKLQTLLKDQMVQAICYFSLDSCDVIIFWLSFSYQRVMDAITSLCHDPACSIQDIFSIQGFQKDYEKMIHQAQTEDEKIPMAQLILRGNQLSMVRQYGRDVLDALSVKVRKVYLLPGQDDATVQAFDVPLKCLIQMVCPKGLLDANQLIKDGVYSHTTLGFGNDGLTREKVVHRNSPMPLLSRKLLTRFRRDMERLPDKTRGYLKSRSWYAALCELFNELSNIESGSTAHDIFTQEIYCQGRFVELLLAQLRRKQHSDPDAMFDWNVQWYLHGWSQLSFHAMHSEWQLTQAYDSNRLYIYPAKLSLFYTAYMHHAAVWLNSGKTDALCTFFLTPKLATDPLFYEIFTSPQKHTQLVLGEIPAELLFRPSELLPVLAHEAAHYTGGDIRCRLTRLMYILRSVALIYMDQFAQDHSIYQKMNHEQKNKVLNLLDESLIDAMIIKMVKQHAKQEPRIDETFRVADEVIHELNMANLEFEVECAIAGAFSDDELRSINGRALEEKCKKQSVSFDNLNARQSFFYNLKSMYREAFADLCMISMLGMNRIDYLKCLARMLSVNQANLDEEVQHRTAHFVRCVTVLRVMSGLQYSEDDAKLVAEIQYDLKQDEEWNRGSDPQTYIWIQGIIMRLSDPRMKQEVNSLASLFFQLYLEECMKKIRALSSSELAGVYRIFSSASEEMDINEIYKECYRLTGQYVDFTRKYLHNAVK